MLSGPRKMRCALVNYGGGLRVTAPTPNPGLEASWDILAKPEYESMQHIDRK